MNPDGWFQRHNVIAFIVACMGCIALGCGLVSIVELIENIGQ